MKKGMILVLTVAAAASQAQVLTQWNFNTNTDWVSPVASTGVGTASLLGTVTGASGSGTANGGSSEGTATGNFGWQTTTYAAQGSNSGTHGVQFAVSTAGFQNIQVRFDTRHSNTSSRFVRFDYSANGGTDWVESTVFEAVNGGDTWYNNRSIDLSSIAAVNDNANFRFRMVTVFAPGSSAYAASSPTGTYATTGTLRWDAVTVSAEPVPEPGTIAALGLGAAALLRRRKK